MTNDTLRLLDSVRVACIEAALAAYEDAGVQGLCAEGRWEAAIEAIRRLDLNGLQNGNAATVGSRREP
jgi:hypothetical protein